jgi:FkbM family methyltransferase
MISRDLASVRLHNSSRLTESSPPTIETAPQQWSYAAEFPVVRDEGQAVQIRVDVEVRAGEIGVGLLTADETAFHVERLVGAQDGRLSVTMTLAPDERSQKIIVRNVGAAGPATLVIHDVVIEPVSVHGIAAPAMPTVDVASAAFRPFAPFSGWVPAGYWVNWIGVLTRAEVWPFSPEVMAVYGRGRHEDCQYPFHDEHVLDWVPLLEGVLASGPLFRMVALGAGWGRWLTAAAFAARQTGRSVHLTGVEAEPNHFAWMREHMRDTAIPADAVRLIHAAASGSRAPCWFPVASPGWYGQSIVSDVNLTQCGEEVRSAAGERLHRVEAVTVEDVVPDGTVVDYLHMDIQGTEYEFLASDPQRLDRSVRMVNIGTHSELIERRLRTLFASLGWQKRYDVSLNTRAQLIVDGQPHGVIPFGDGVQVWTNPRL